MHIVVFALREDFAMYWLDNYLFHHEQEGPMIFNSPGLQVGDQSNIFRALAKILRT